MQKSSPMRTGLLLLLILNLVGILAGGPLASATTKSKLTINELFRDNEGNRVFIGTETSSVPAQNDNAQFYWMPVDDDKVYVLWATIRQHRLGIWRIHMNYPGGDMVTIISSTGRLVWNHGMREQRFERQSTQAKAQLQRQIQIEKPKFVRALPHWPEYVLARPDGSYILIDRVGRSRESEVRRAYLIYPRESISELTITSFQRPENGMTTDIELSLEEKSFGKLHLEPSYLPRAKNTLIRSFFSRENLKLEEPNIEVLMKLQVDYSLYYPPSPADVCEDLLAPQ